MTARVVDRNEQDLSKFALAINELASGRSNAVGTCTLTANVASTVVTNANCAVGSTVILSQKTSNAAAALATSYWAAANGSFTIQHANNAQTDRTFAYAIVG